MSCGEQLLVERTSFCACDLEQEISSGEDVDGWKVTCHVCLQLVGGVDRDFANLAPESRFKIVSFPIRGRHHVIIIPVFFLARRPVVEFMCGGRLLGLGLH